MNIITAHNILEYTIIHMDIWMLERSSHLVHSLLQLYSFILNFMTMISLIKFQTGSLIAANCHFIGKKNNFEFYSVWICCCGVGSISESVIKFTCKLLKSFSINFLLFLFLIPSKNFNRIFVGKLAHPPLFILIFSFHFYSQ